ncbi:response regulator [Actinoplanes sp. NPDC051851]|uniref:response regulator n=1 Tax=Actinoplanes sp. NPDC051851 TaxID=3154753 RepID=UPI0034447AAC
MAFKTRTKPVATDTANHTVLVVDDDPGVRDLIAFILGRTGYRVITAADGPTALDVFRESRPDLVLLDFVMPGLDGVSVCSRIREEAEAARIPVVMMSGQATKEQIGRAFASGAAEYVDKPVQLPELVALMRTYLSS